MARISTKASRLLRKKRQRVRGTSARPRAAVFRSLSHIYIQLIDDENGATILSVSDREIEGAARKGKTKSEVARAVGLSAGKKAKEKKITHVSFDRAGYRYHGRVKALADGMREAGITF